MENKTYIDTITFVSPLNVDFGTVFGMIDSNHYQDCCENHYLDFDSSKEDFKMAEDLLKKIDKMEIYGEDGMGVTFFFYDGETRVGIFVPGRGYNNGYYGNNLELIITTPENGKFEYDITEYQDIDG